MHCIFRIDAPAIRPARLVVCHSRFCYLQCSEDAVRAFEKQLKEVDLGSVADIFSSTMKASEGETDAHKGIRCNLSRATISVEFVHWPGDAAAKSGEASVAAGLEPVRDVASLSGSSGKDV